MQFFSAIVVASFIISSNGLGEDREVSPFLNTDQLGKLLKEIGYEPIPLSRDVFQITIDRNGWKVHLLVSLSKEGERVWLESKFSPIAEPDRVPASAWKQLLETNDKIGPAHFVFDKADKRIHILKAFDNNHITMERLKKEIAALDATIRDTHPVWRSEVFLPERELLTVAPRVLEDAKLALARFQGEWRIVQIELRGKVVKESELADSKPTMTFTEESACLKSSADSQRNVKVRLNPGVPLKQIDFVDENGRVEKGIYQREGETIKLCFAAPGAERPVRFVADEDSGTWVLVLKRKP